jgi:hypothetical protein
VGAGFCTPLSRTSSTTPITSRHGDFGSVLMRLPTAWSAPPHNSRARFSEIIKPGRRS